MCTPGILPRRSVLSRAGRPWWDDACRKVVVDVAEAALPATVVTAHLVACAKSLAAADLPFADLPETVDDLVAGQRHISAALSALAGRLTRGPVTENRTALIEVLRAAAAASSHAADALAAGEQLFEIIADETRF